MVQGEHDESTDQFTEEFKRDVVEQSYRTDESLREFALAMGAGQSTLTNWRKQRRELGPDSFPGKGRQTPQNAQITRLKRDLRQARQERDVLKKAPAFFAQASP